MGPMADPGELRGELDDVLALAARAAQDYLAGIDDQPVQPQAGAEALAALDGSLPERGAGAEAAVTRLVELGNAAATRSAGPRFFHFVMGGGTPAALAADWLTSAFDQIAFARDSSPMASRLEQLVLRWLVELFELPDEFDGVLVTGATMANFTCLAAARNWWAEANGVDVETDGLGGRPGVPVLSSGYLHPSARQALGMLGIGRHARIFASDAAGRLDAAAMERELAELDGAHAIVIGNAGEVNTGDFDPIDELADIAERHGAWLHVDGAFGMFARLAPESAPLAAGIERAQSITVDAHKWLNVPYDCGVALLREPNRLASTFAMGAAYLPEVREEQPDFGYRSPENSRRAKALTLWATLAAYGRDGYRAMVERHLALARRLGERVDAEPELERLADVKLNIVCFRWHPEGAADGELDDLNRKLGAALVEDGRVLAGTTVYEGKVAFRPAIVNWRTREEDVDLLVDVLLELASGLR
jgi:glutamate/tyrosine decarboxylase-like PLP-dependent enzyme